MAKVKQTSKSEDEKTGLEDISSIITSRVRVAQDYLSTKRTAWDEYEQLFSGTLGDAKSTVSKNQVFDHKLSTQVMERSARVMSQMATGKVKAISKNDEGASKLMNLILDKYILPNANSQFDFLTKLRMVDLYSNIYGNYFAMVDWNVKEDGYVGPDLFLIPIRDVFPQVGAISLEDSDYVIVRTWRTLDWFKSLIGDSEFKSAKKIYNLLKDKAGDKKDSEDKSDRENENSNDQEAKGKGYYIVYSMYEKDRWVDYVPGADMVLRDIPNPHENGELPLVNKYSIPLVDDFMGIGDFERGKSMQYLVNSLWNLYLDAVKVSIFPPTLINKDNIADASSYKWTQAAKWLVKGQTNNAAQVLNLTPQGANTFNNVYGIASASLMNMFGTTDTSTKQDTAQEFGRTPQALKMQAERENSRDNVDRFYMEQFISKVIKKFINLMSKKQTGSIALRMFEPEMEELGNQFEDMGEMFNEKTGKLTINKSKFGSLLYDYEIVPNSTYAVDQAKQQENLMNLLMTVKENMTLTPTGITSPIMEAVKAEGKEIKVGELFTRIIANSGIQDWDKIIVDQKDNPDSILQDHANQFMAALQDAGGVNGVPPQPGQPQGQPMPQTGALPVANEPSIETNQPF